VQVPILIFSSLLSCRVDARQQEVHLAIPSSGAGLILGKGGENIKALQAESGSRMRISGKV
jgi:ribosomal protein S3